MNEITRRLTSGIAKYLSQYAEVECVLLEDVPTLSWQHCLVIPCYDESLDFIRSIETQFKTQSDILVVLIINQPDNTDEVNNNIQLLKFFKSNFELVWGKGNLNFFSSIRKNITWLVVDRFSAGQRIPIQQGVGLARKIGCDLAITLYSKHQISSSWIHCSDADTELPIDYFNLAARANHQNYSAAIYAFKHVSTPKFETKIFEATQLYEQSLHYYVDGLTWAGSPYNFQTIGSTLAYSVESYCAVRGFPKLAAGEDFYMINKLRKIGPIYQLKDIELKIEARLSTRVPFGTGPAVESILQLANPSKDYRYYAPKTFIALKYWLDFIPSVWQEIQASHDPLEHLPKSIRQALLDARIHRLLNHIRTQVKTENACRKALHEWFDGFQTLKFIRRMQESSFPALPLYQCLAEAPFYGNEKTG